MKLLLSLSLAFLSVAVFTSCKKEYKCECYSPSLNKTLSYNIKDKKTNAKAECEAQPITGRYTGTDYICNIK